MPDELIKELDPKLRRLALTMGNAGRLSADRRAGTVTAAEDTSPTDLAAHSKHVLVQLSPDRVPDRYMTLRWRRLTEGIYSVTVPITELEGLAREPAVKFIEAGRPVRTDLDTSIAATRADVLHRGGAPPAPPLRGRGVIVGIIDFGFDFTLDDFRDPASGSTRIAFFWDQSLTPTGVEHAPAGFGYGVEYTDRDINTALTSVNPFALVRHIPEAGAHGTHVTGIAAGNGTSASAAFPAGRFVGAAPEATLILVQPATEEGIDTFADSARVADAVAYIFERAQDLNQPCVINMSLGQNGGSHDGESVVERAIDRLLEVPGRAFVAAAGNEHVWQTHASGVLTIGAIRTLRWRVGGTLPGFPPPPAGVRDRTPNEMEVWYSSRDVLSVRVIEPGGTATAAVQPGTASMFALAGHDVYVDSERFTRLNGDARIYIEVSHPTGLLTSGTWRVELTSVRSRNGRVDAWIERDARDRARGFVDQSFFEAGDFDPTMTLGTPATGRRAIVVANYDHQAVVPSTSSGRGRTRDGRQKPECAAPGTNITSSGSMGGRPLPGGLVAPMRVTKSGTSMAAPHVTGIVALIFERARSLPSPQVLTTEQVRKVLTASASPPAGVPVFDDAWGFGQVDAVEAISVL